MLRLDTLNAPQRRAVLHPAGRPLVVFAGAGSGKTRVITHRIAHLSSGEGVPLGRVLAVTFTNKAAAEMRDRLATLVPGLVGAGGSRGLWVGTFHATCARLLRQHADGLGLRRDFVIYDDDDQKTLVARILRDLGLSDRQFPPKQVLGRIHRAKQEAIGVDAFPAADPYADTLKRVYGEYEARLARAGALDFDDLICRLVVALEASPGLLADVSGRFDHVLVDEFQDTNHVQFRLVHALARVHRNLCVVGDDDQSIYRWRGADRRNILDFRRHFPDAEVIKLEQNYRSTQRILRAAHAVIARNTDREPKELWTENEEGPPVLGLRCDDERDEARLVVEAVRKFRDEDVPLADQVVFYRTHAQSRVLEEALRARNIPYQVVGGMRFYDRAEIKDVLAYLRTVHNPDDDVSLLRIVNTPARGIGKTTLDRVTERAARRRQSVWETLREGEGLAELGTAARQRLEAFVTLLEGLRRDVLAGVSLVELARAVVERSGYEASLQSDDSVEAETRLGNVHELVGSVGDFVAEAETPTLASFLELVTLQTTADEVGSGDRLTLMTVHAAKGLEFPVVLVAGLEEGVFPLRGVGLLDDPEELEEERRLAYVAFTRARERLVLTWATTRTLYGERRVNRRSRFVDDVPLADLEVLGERPSAPPRPAPAAPAPRQAGWDLRPGLGAGPARAASGESYVDRSEGTDLDDAPLRRGMRVRHVKFGVGEVQALLDGVPPRVAVRFPGWGTKSIVASYLEPD